MDVRPALMLAGLVSLFSPIHAPAQEQLSTLDEIEDSNERRALLAAYQAKDADRRLVLAKAFLGAYPQSAFLMHAYDVAAQAALAAEKFDEALELAGQALHLMPENPVLLLAAAQIHATRGNHQPARANAIEAFEYLDRFARPASIPERDWPSVEKKLKTSALNAHARASIALGLASANIPKRQVLLREAIQVLKRAAGLTPDTEVRYMLGLCHASLGEADEAIRNFKAAALGEGPAKEKAAQQLRRLHKVVRPGVPFAEFLESVPESKYGQEGEPQKLEGRGEYLGSKACQPCHTRQYASWEVTGMARMFRRYLPESVIGDFNENTEFRDGSARVVARMGIDRERHFFELLSSGGEWNRYFVEYIIGSKWQQAYATRAPGGGIHVLPIQYNTVRKQWLNYWSMIDPPGSARADISGFHRMQSSTNYQRNCASCHTSQLAARTTREAALETAEFREGGVNCEMCHGPSGRHVSNMKAGRSYRANSSGSPVEFRNIDSRSYVAICAQCHMQSAMREMGAAGQINYSESGTFYTSYRSRPYVEFSRKAFYKDGRFRETTFIAESFQRSQCFRKGQAHCGHCHDPHPANPQQNPKSLKFISDPDQMCLQCHTSYRDDLKRHTRHDPVSEASRCQSCHMPKIMNSLLFQAGSHQIDDIPDAGMTMRFGQAESPNACLVCHSDRNAVWLQTQLTRW